MAGSPLLRRLQYLAGLYHFLVPEDTLPNTDAEGKAMYLAYHKYAGGEGGSPRRGRMHDASKLRLMRAVFSPSWGAGLFLCNQI
eukprot:scaffold8_cov249-Pinguiococcus_pyrenoidosus.AAC.19